MCILFVYVDDGSRSGRYRLVLASNRDEFYARPAKTAAPWEENERIIGGRDMEPGREGGTWLAIGNHPPGRIRLGALLNVTGETKANVTNGRGPIVANYLTSNGDHTARYYSEQLLANDNFGAFNLVSIDLATLVEPASNSGGDLAAPKPSGGIGVVLHTSNTPHSIASCALGTALGFGNSTLDKPLQKVCRGRERFEEIVTKRNVPFADKDAFVDDLLDLLKSDVRHYPDPELTRRAGQHAEYLSSVNVRVPGGSYGSRTRTIILIDHQNRMEFIEETMVNSDPESPDWTTTRIVRDLS
ncbi:transport and Golgi organization protein 2 [Anopheles aquasalis]|uniref:transport and Golgi organization protein 2 n=1 Tax=Anopheles aquasalis TaxID=42839 RepID=UPI00215B65F1|nr:transport and Golgi organization protein 2 [Anopheles aquasalis]XP_050101289.1 transport and Golgi organization protein 2 [Anopheles aquasalis]